MRGAISPLTQYAFLACCLVKAQGQLYLLRFNSVEIYTILSPSTVSKQDSVRIMFVSSLMCAACPAHLNLPDVIVLMELLTLLLHVYEVQIFHSAGPSGRAF